MQLKARSSANETEDSLVLTKPCCQKPAEGHAASTSRPDSKATKYLLSGAALLVVWFALYLSLAAVSQWFTYGPLGLERGQHFSVAVEFFVFETPKVLLLLTALVFGVGVIRSFFTPERTRGLDDILTFRHSTKYSARHARVYENHQGAGR